MRLLGDSGCLELFLYGIRELNPGPHLSFPLFRVRNIRKYFSKILENISVRVGLRGDQRGPGDRTVRRGGAGDGEAQSPAESPAEGQSGDLSLVQIHPDTAL